MSNIETNRISYTLTAEKRERINTLLAELDSELNFVVGLTADERRKLPKISKSNKLFVEDAITASIQNTSVMPSYIKPEEMKKDFTLFTDINSILLSLESLYNKVRDTQMLAGSEAYTSALMVYKMFKAAAEAGVPGTQAVYDSLRERFAQIAVAEPQGETADDTPEA